MKKLLLLVGTVVSMNSYAQVTLFQDDFESGAGNWMLNGGTGNNQWTVNNTYIGDDFGIVNDTPDEPGTFNGGVNSYYMHIYNTDLCSIANGCNANFDTGSSSNQSATQSSPVSTSGFNNVTLEFYYLCAGAAGTSYGVAEYSTDGGTTWSAAGSQYSGVSSWTPVTITNAAFNNQSSLKFRFRWQNGSAGSDPAFAVDEVKLTGTQGNFVSLATGAIPTNSFCSNTSTNITINFVATGSVNSGNQYLAKLSDASGSFASPLTIGTLTSTTTGSLSINATVPSGLPAGNAYKVRVDASDPNTVGAVSASTLTVNAPPTVSFISLPASGVICSGQSATIQASGGNSYSWSPSGSLNNSNTATVSANPTSTTTYTVIVTAQTGCSATGTFTLQVDNCASLTENSEVQLTLYPNPAKDELFIQLPENDSFRDMKITDLSGRTVKQFNELMTKIDISEFISGSYILLISGDQGTIRKTFIKE